MIVSESEKDETFILLVTAKLYLAEMPSNALYQECESLAGPY